MVFLSSPLLIALTSVCSAVINKSKHGICLFLTHLPFYFALAVKNNIFLYKFLNIFMAGFWVCRSENLLKTSDYILSSSSVLLLFFLSF